MPKIIQLTRRRFIVSVTLFLAALATGLGCARKKSEEWHRAKQWMIEWAESVKGSRGADLVGKRYLEQYPEETDIEELVDRFLRDLREEDWLPKSKDELNEAVRARVLYEYEMDLSLVVFDWHLSRPEARLLALGHLLT